MQTTMLPATAKIICSYNTSTTGNENGINYRDADHQRGAAADAKQAGIGHWIAKKSLHNDPCRSQRSTDQNGQQYAGQADVQPDISVFVVEQGAEANVQRPLAGTEQHQSEPAREKGPSEC